MPEGPEIRRVATRINKVLAGREAQKVVFTQPLVARFGQQLSGQCVEWVSSRGKALLTHFDNGYVFVEGEIGISRTLQFLPLFESTLGTNSFGSVIDQNDPTDGYGND